MAASSFVPAPRRVPGRTPASRAVIATAAARTAPRGAGLAEVVALPLRGRADAPLAAVPATAPATVPSVAPATAPDLRLVAPARVAPRWRTAVLAAVVLAALLVLGGTVAAAAGSGTGDLAVAGHVVLQPGETLWDVAVRSAPAGVDPRRQLDDIRRVNGFRSGTLDAWTVVLIPAP